MEPYPQTDNFPFFSHATFNDIFDHPLANGEQANQLQMCSRGCEKEDVLKIEAPTSPMAVAMDIPNNFAQNLKIHKPSRRLKTKKIAHDGDYRPHRRSKKSSKSNTVRQKQDRNLIPNSVHHILSFVQKRFRSGTIVEKIFSLHCKNPSFSPLRYYIFHKLLRVNLNHYVNETALKIVSEPGNINFDQFGKSEQTFYCFVSRILIRYFLKNQAIMMILVSRKVKKDSILERMRLQRLLYENVIAAQK